MKGKALFIILLLLSMGMVGCLGLGAAKDLKEDEIEVYNLQIQGNYSHQFNNIAPMSMGNQTVYSLWNNSSMGELYATINITAHFHQPTLWDKGSVNVSLVDDNGTVLWFSNEINESVELVWNGLIEGHNLTVRITASGSDDPADNEVADYYIVNFWANYQWVGSA